MSVLQVRDILYTAVWITSRLIYSGSVVRGTTDIPDSCQSDESRRHCKYQQPSRSYKYCAESREVQLTYCQNKLTFLLTITYRQCNSHMKRMLRFSGNFNCLFIVSTFEDTISIFTYLRQLLVKNSHSTLSERLNESGVCKICDFASIVVCILNKKPSYRQDSRLYCHRAVRTVQPQYIT